MKLNYPRIRARLESKGFVPRGTGGSENVWPFVRADGQVPNLFQQIDLSFFGRYREAVGAHRPPYDDRGGRSSNRRAGCARRIATTSPG